MNTSCFICNTRAGLPLRAVNLFNENSIPSSNRKFCDVLSEIIEKPVQIQDIHSSVLCTQCANNVSDYENMKVRISSIKSEVQGLYNKNASLYETSKLLKKEQSISKFPIKVVAGNTDPKLKRVVLSKSKLQPVPAELLNNLYESGRFNLKSCLSKVSSVKSPQATSSQSTQKQDTSLITSLIKQKTDIIHTTSVLNYGINTLPKDFMETPLKKNIEDKTEDDNDSMEIDEDCPLTVVPVPTSDSGQLMFQVEGIKTETHGNGNGNQYIDLELPSLDGADTQKYILSKLEEIGQNDEDNEQTTILMSSDADNEGILRMVGQKLVYDGSNISLVLPLANDDTNDTGNDSNDDSQIEFRVSGDEETANAIIAAAQEQGGAFIKVESGEMYRVQSVQSAPAGDMVARHGDAFRCLLCRRKDADGTQTVGDAAAMMRHLKDVHAARGYICRLCGHVMRRRTDYHKHLAEHQIAQPADAKKPHKCTVCGRTYSSRTLLTEHMHSHSGAKPHSCDVCGKNFASKYTHQAHMKTHQDRPRPHKCNTCGRSFLTHQNLSQHERTHTGQKDFVCKVCDKAFGTQHNLEVHGVVHSGNKPFVCGVCDKAFARRAEIRDHMRIHTGERPFACDICNAAFTQRSNLHSHKRATHLNDKRHQCPHCPKKFKRRRLLDYHIKATHTGERPLLCEVCNASFVYPEHYKKHIRIHSGERPYICEICGKSFNSRDNRNTHRFVHSDKKPYECLACGAGYMRKMQLLQHMDSSGHLAESIVVNQPRVTKIVENGVSTKIIDVVKAIEDKTAHTTIQNTLFEEEELEFHAGDNSKLSGKSEEGVSNLFFSGDKKFILSDNKLSLVQETVDPMILQNLANSSAVADGSILETVDAEALTGQAQFITNDENGSVLRLIQIKLADGNDGWVAIDP